MREYAQKASVTSRHVLKLKAKAVPLHATEALGGGGEEV
jgi:hypothetical protein